MATVTKSTKPLSAKAIDRKWNVIDLEGKILGRAINEISYLLQGKNKTMYSPNIDSGDFVIVINASKVKLTGKKAQTKEYTNFSGYPGGLRTVTFKTLLDKRPQEIVRHAVSGMLPKNKLRDRRMARLFIFADENHPYKDRI
jgi:large subunit ribosomal protein L13